MVVLRGVRRFFLLTAVGPLMLDAAQSLWFSEAVASSSLICTGLTATGRDIAGDGCDGTCGVSACSGACCCDISG